MIVVRKFTLNRRTIYIYRYKYTYVRMYSTYILTHTHIRVCVCVCVCVCARKNNVYIYEIMQDDAALDLLANMTLMEFLRSLHSELSFDDSARLLR
jgi:hypothetical protein